MWYRRRRGGIFGFPFILFIIALFVFHSWFGFMVGLGIFIIVGLLIRAALFGAGSGPWGQRPYQQTQQPYDQYYQPYQPYEQGYQPPAPTYQEPQYQAPPPQYDEQPQAQYPQELPPMEQ